MDAFNFKQILNATAFAGDIWPSSGLIRDNWEKICSLQCTFSKEIWPWDSRNPGKPPGKEWAFLGFL